MKSVMKDMMTTSKTVGKVIVGMIVFLAVIAVLTVLFTGKANAAGWEVDNVTTDGRVMSIHNRGDQGGFLKLTCDADTKHLSLQYLFEDKEYDFFMFRNFGDTDMTNTRNKLLVGMGVTTQADVFRTLLVNSVAFSAARFPIGTKAIMDEAFRTKKPNPPELIQEGEEYFLAGTEVGSLLNKIGATCPFVTDDQTVIF